MSEDESAAGVYDWRSVEQQLESMRANRMETTRQRLVANASHSTRFRSPSPAFCIAEDFELQAVGDSDSNSSSDSESDLVGGRHVHGSGRTVQVFAQKSVRKRLKDSLDLSMSTSVADLRAFLPRERHQATQLINKPTADTLAPISPIAPPPATSAAGINPSCQPSSSALIQRRRQLEQEAAMAKDESNQAHLTGFGCEKATLKTAGSNASRLQSKIVQPSSRLQRGNDPTAQVVDSEAKLTTNTRSNVEPKTQSHLAAPTAISARTREVLKKPMASIASNQDQTADPIASSRLTLKPTAAAAPVVPSIAAELPSKCMNRAPQPIEPEDDEATLHSEEEARLLRSLENLDTRLTRLAVTKPTAKSGGDNQNPRCSNRDDHIDRHCGSTRSGLKRVDSPQEDCAPDDDEELLRRAAYGGGTHHRSLQQTSPSVRTSCLKRAEISGGLSRARVRPGAPMAAETINRDADGRHKVVVKKDLAHLLFFN